MKSYNVIQKELINKSEKAHFEGIRHKGLSGTICENLLIKALRENIPGVNFDRGVIKFCSPELKGKNIRKGDISSQIDIIIYRGKPLFEIEGNVVVHISQVFGVIEVKKWTYPSTIKSDGPVVRSINKIKRQLSDKTNRKIHIFFVTYRFSDRRNKNITWFTEKDKIPIENKYCFFGSFSTKKGWAIYPPEDPEWTNLEKGPYSSQFEKLVEDIKKLTKTISHTYTC